jgi:hypothetical protein
VRRRAVWGLTAFVVLAVAAGTFLALRTGRHIVVVESCVAQVGSVQARLDPEQAGNAATIAAVASRRGLPARAVTIALATAMQESKLRNVTHGDRDSLGLFQQRPSQGWGTAQQVLDPVYASGRFYDALVKIPNYRTLSITQAAQKVQRSGFPTAYADHEPEARALASALMGYSEAAFTCSLRSPSGSREQIGPTGLTARAARVRSEVQAAFGPQQASANGAALDLLYQPVTAERRRQGWASAQWLVANARRLQITAVTYDDRIWSAGRSTQGWRRYVPAGTAAAKATAAERRQDRVHVEVVAG